MLAAVVMFALAASEQDCQYSQRQWSQIGLDAPCVVLTAPSPPAQLGTAMARWSLTEPQARCAIAAAHQIRREVDGESRSGVGNAEDWRGCVGQWPEAKALWVGFMAAWDYRSAESLVAKLPAAPLDGGPSLAEELLQLDFGPRAALALHVLKTQPHQLPKYLGGLDDFEIALTTLSQRRATIRPEDWDLLGQALVSLPLLSGDLVLAANLWMELPEHTRATVRSAPIPWISSCSQGDRWGRCENGDQRPLLALGLIVAGHPDEARLIPLAGDPFLKDLVTWHLTGKRTLDPWDAAIEARLRLRQRKGGDFYAALFPFIAPHFVLHDVRRQVDDGFASEAARNGHSAATIARLRSARARSFIRLQELAAKLGPRNRDGDRLAQLPTDLLQDAALQTLVTRAGGPSGLTVFSNGSDHVFIELSNGLCRADREPSGKWKVTILSEWIRCF